MYLHDAPPGHVWGLLRARRDVRHWLLLQAWQDAVDWESQSIEDWALLLSRVRTCLVLGTGLAPAAATHLPRREPGLPRPRRVRPDKAVSTVDTVGETEVAGPKGPPAVPSRGRAATPRKRPCVLQTPTPAATETFQAVLATVTVTEMVETGVDDGQMAVARRPAFGPTRRPVPPGRDEMTRLVAVPRPVVARPLVLHTTVAADRRVVAGHAHGHSVGGVGVAVTPVPPFVTSLVRPLRHADDVPQDTGVVVPRPAASVVVVPRLGPPDTRGAGLPSRGPPRPRRRDLSPWVLRPATAFLVMLRPQVRDEAVAEVPRRRRRTAGRVALGHTGVGDDVETAVQLRDGLRDTTPGLVRAETAPPRGPPANDDVGQVAALATRAVALRRRRPPLGRVGTTPAPGPLEMGHVLTFYAGRLAFRPLAPPEPVGLPSETGVAGLAPGRLAVRPPRLPSPTAASRRLLGLAPRLPTLHVGRAAVPAPSRPATPPLPSYCLDHVKGPDPDSKLELAHRKR